MGATVSARNLRAMMEHKGKDWTVKHLTEAMEKKQLRPEDFSIAELARGLNGEDWFNHLRSQRGGFCTLTEAANAVDTSAFSGITGQLVFNKVLDAYQSPDLLWPDLLDSFQTQFLTGERLPGIGEVGDQFTNPIGEAEDFPNIGVNEEFIDTPALQKRGGIVPVTKEIITADHTGILLGRCQSGGKGLGVNTERRALDVATGQTNNYKRNTVSTNTYLTSGAYINSQSNVLVDHTDLENSEVLQSAITDPNTGLFIASELTHLLLPLELKKTALRIINSTEVAVVDNTAGANTMRQFSDAPKTLYDKRFSSLKVLSNQYVKERTSSASTWFAFADPKKVFGRTYAWEILTETAGANSERAFQADILMRFKVSVMDAIWVKNPRYAVRNQ